jgi:GNAT superfamily N-acetyltransferase
MILFQREPANSCFEEAMPLIVNYRREVDYYQDFQLDPEFAKYAELEKAGVVRAYTAREDGKLIGFALFFFTPHLHFKSKIFAMHDILYIIPEKRGFGHRFIKWCDEQLTADGADVIYFFVNGNFNYSPILRRCGYAHADDLYIRRVK